MGNMFKTAVLLAALTALLLLIGDFLGGAQGMVVAFGFALLINFGSYWFSDRIVLAMYGAQPVDEAAAPEIYRVIRTLTSRAGLPMPRVYIIPEDTPNAFATGRNPAHAAVAVTQGILRVLSEDELEGVLAHELSHVKNRDTLTMTLAATLAGAVTMVARMAGYAAMFGGGRRSDNDDSGGSAFGAIVMMIVAPIAAILIQLAISRAREFQADASGARMAGRPWGLPKALEKLDIASKLAPMDATPATAHLFIVNPLRGAGGLSTLFSTHPPIEERIARLRAMSL